MEIYPLDLCKTLTETPMSEWPRYVALDTETSGLYVDDGARPSTVSVAFEDPDGHFIPLHVPDGQHYWESGVWSVLNTEIGTIPRRIVSFAWPFDQGVVGTGKPEDPNLDIAPGDGMLPVDLPLLPPDVENLAQEQWLFLRSFLMRLGEVHGRYLVMHHAKFDLHMMRAGHRVYGLGLDLSDWLEWDTQNVAEMLWSYTGTTSLKPTCARLWGTEIQDEQNVVKEYLRKKKLPKGRWDLMPWEVIGRYADIDAQITLRLMLEQESRLRDGEAHWLDGRNGRLTWMQAVERRLQTSLMLYRLECRGLPFDHKGARKVMYELNRRAAELKRQLPFSPATINAAKKYWFEELGEEPIKRTDSGAPSVDAQVVGKMSAAGVPGADLWRRLQKIQTSNTRWYEGWGNMVGKDGRLRGTIRQNGTRSTRFSIERVQLQAIPHDYKLKGDALDGVRTPRQLIGDAIPEGYELWELDLANAELRVAALYAKCKRMLELIDQGLDLHGDAAQALFHVKPDDEDWGKWRSVAKRFNFSAIFGVGWETMQAAVDEQAGVFLPDKEAKMTIYRWNALYPEYKKMINRVQEAVEERMHANGGKGWIATKTGERRWFAPGEDTHKAFNQMVQANLAQYGIDWWLATEELVDRRLRELCTPDEIERHGLGMVMLIHDSVILLLPQTEQGDAIVTEVQELGVRLWERRFPGVPGGVDAERWRSKG